MHSHGYDIQFIIHMYPGLNTKARNKQIGKLSSTYGLFINVIIDCIASDPISFLHTRIIDVTLCQHHTITYIYNNE